MGLGMKTEGQRTTTDDKRRNGNNNQAKVSDAKMNGGVNGST